MRIFLPTCSASLMKVKPVLAITPRQASRSATNAARFNGLSSTLPSSRGAPNPAIESEPVAAHGVQGPHHLRDGLERHVDQDVLPFALAFAPALASASASASAFVGRGSAELIEAHGGRQDGPVEVVPVQAQRDRGGREALHHHAIEQVQARHRYAPVRKCIEMPDTDGRECPAASRSGPRRARSRSRSGPARRYRTRRCPAPFRRSAIGASSPRWLIRPRRVTKVSPRRTVYGSKTGSSHSGSIGGPLNRIWTSWPRALSAATMGRALVRCPRPVVWTP